MSKWANERMSKWAISEWGNEQIPSPALVTLPLLLSSVMPILLCLWWFLSINFFTLSLCWSGPSYLVTLLLPLRSVSLFLSILPVSLSLCLPRSLLSLFLPICLSLLFHSMNSKTERGERSVSSVVRVRQCHHLYSVYFYPWLPPPLHLLPEISSKARPQSNMSN